MNLVVTGSLGHISRPLAMDLVKKGHAVTVISSQPGRRKEIEALGATPAIGRIEDADFLGVAFSGADAVYTMIPPGNYFDRHFDLNAAARHMVGNYVRAIRRAGPRRVVHLSSIGAHRDRGNGILGIYYHLEKMLAALPAEIAITIMRPVGFYSNLLGFMDTIRTQGVIATNYGGDEKRPWVSPLDIAEAVAEEMVASSSGRKVRYVASDEVGCNEAAAILGAAIGRPELKWTVISDQQLLEGMKAAGMNPEIAAGLVEMNASRRSGKLYEDFDRNRPALGRVKLAEFAKEFATVFRKG